MSGGSVPCATAPRRDAADVVAADHLYERALERARAQDNRIFALRATVEPGPPAGGGAETCRLRVTCSRRRSRAAWPRDDTPELAEAQSGSTRSEAVPGVQ
jgi:hypothetical protein